MTSFELFAELRKLGSNVAIHSINWGQYVHGMNGISDTMGQEKW